MKNYLGSFSKLFLISLLAGSMMLAGCGESNPTGANVSDETTNQQSSSNNNTTNTTEEQQKTREGELILRQIQSGDHVVLLDEHGKEMRSMEFATWIEKRQQTVRRLVFVIGGPYGFSEEMYSRCNEKLSLSKMTFSHQMVRLIFTEQLYRACTIIKGEPYHHE